MPPDLNQDIFFKSETAIQFQQQTGHPLLTRYGKLFDSKFEYESVNCNFCARTTLEHLGTKFRYFKYEEVLKTNWSNLQGTHVWGQLRCRATGGIIGTIDFWAEFYDFFRVGRDSFGYSGGNHPDLESEWTFECDSKRKYGCGDVLPPKGAPTTTPYGSPRPNPTDDPPIQKHIPVYFFPG